MVRNQYWKCEKENQREEDVHLMFMIIISIKALHPFYKMFIRQTRESYKEREECEIYMQWEKS